MSLFLKIGPVIALVLMTFAYLHERDARVEAIEQCNSEKLASIAEAERITREVTTSAMESRIQQLESTALNAQKARDIAIQARLEAESRPERVRTVIQRVRDQDACIDTAVHPDLLGCLRNDQNCGETRTR